MFKRHLHSFSYTLLCVLWVATATSAVLHHSLPADSPWSDDPADVLGRDVVPPFVLVLNDWPSQSVFSHIVGRLIESTGLPVAYMSSDTRLQFDLLATGDAHFQVEVWHNRMRADFHAAMDRGVVHAGEHKLRFQDGWWVSDAVLAVCPNAADWAGFAACATRRADETGSAGAEFVGPPAHFGRDYSELIDLLGMPVAQRPAESAEVLYALWRSVDATGRVVQSQPLQAVYAWSPNTQSELTRGQFMQFPAHEAACFRDPAWGPNPDVTGDCGDPAYYPITKAAWAGVLDAYPSVWPILQAVSFDADDFSQVVAWMEEPGAEPEMVASRWIESHPDRVQQWLVPESEFLEP